MNNVSHAFWKKTLMHCTGYPTEETWGIVAINFFVIILFDSR